MTDVFLESGQSQILSFNGPIRTGLFLESKTFLVDGYQEFQKEFMNTLSGSASGVWGASNFMTYSDGSEVQRDTVRGQPIIPQYFISRILKNTSLMEALEQLELPGQLDALPFRDEDAPPPTLEEIEENKELPPPATFLISQIEIRMNDFGYGSVIFSGALRANQDLGILEVKEAGKCISDQLEVFTPLFRSTFETVWTHTPSDILSNAAFVSNIKAKQNNQYLGRNKEIGTMVNAIRIFEVPCPDEETFIKYRDHYVEKLFARDEKFIEDASLDKENMAIFIGHGNHIVVYREQKVTHWQRSLLRRAMQVKNVFYTMFEEVSENLIHINSSISLDDAHPNPSLLEEKARILAEYRARSEFFRAVYDDYDNHLDPQSLKIWRVVEETWETEDRNYALKNQLDLAGSIHDRLMQDLDHTHNKKVGSFILVFTVLGMLSVIMDLVDFTQEGSLTSPDTLRLVLMCLLILLAFLFSFRIRFKSESRASIS